MLSNFGTANLEMLKQSLNTVWGQNARITDIRVIDRPFDMFEINLTINNRHKVLISYDRSIVDISIHKNDEYEWLTDLTDIEVVEGFDSCKPENLVHNFEVLDKVLRSI